MHRYIDDYLDDLHVMVKQILADFVALQRRLAIWSRDGYPTGTDRQTRGATIGDPTAAAVLAPDEVRRDREQLAQLITQAHEIMTKAEGIRSKYMTAAKQAERHNRSLTRCANIHGCPDDMWAAKAGRCLACYEYRRVNHSDRVPRTGNRKAS